jgi:hypothetical protein
MSSRHFEKASLPRAKAIGTAARVIRSALLGRRGGLAASKQEGGRHGGQMSVTHESFPVDMLGLKFKQENGCFTAARI